jgi:hypothetical protein
MPSSTDLLIDVTSLFHQFAEACAGTFTNSNHAATLAKTRQMLPCIMLCPKIAQHYRIPQRNIAN